MIQVVILGSSPHDMALDVDVDKVCVLPATYVVAETPFTRQRQQFDN